MKKNIGYEVTIDARNASTHRLQVTIQTKNDEHFPALLQFPVWTPGSYMVREYSRHITCFAGGKKENKNSWRIDSRVKKISYEVYCFEKTVRTSYLDGNFMTLVGATILPILSKELSVRLLLPKNWSFVSSALEFHKVRAGEWSTIVADIDRWIDCPIIASAPSFGGTGSFRSKGITHEIAWVGYDCARAMKDLERDFKKIADTVLQMFGGAPMKKYHFLLHFGAKMYGGLEHRDSQLSQFDGTTLADDKEYKSFLRLVAHEYFHSWNVKSIRPKALGPFNYFQENYTEDLWFAEGITDYFDDIIPLKAGLFTQKDFLEERFDDVKSMNDSLPGHTRRSLAEASLDAWIRAYKPDEDSANSDVSYYAKGSLLGWCWDAHLQKKSRGKWTLEKLMRAIWKEFGIDAYETLLPARAGFTREELLKFAEKVTGISQRTQVEAWVSSRKALPWREAAKFFKISWKEKTADPIAQLLGMQIQWKSGQAIVQKVFAGSAAQKAGLAAGDEVISANQYRITDAQRLNHALRASPKALKLCYARSDKVHNTRVSPRKHGDLGIEFFV